jgi:putative membrane protein
MYLTGAGTSDSALKAQLREEWTYQLLEAEGVMMWGYRQGMSWMWLWAPLLLTGIASLVLLAVRVVGGGIRGGHGLGRSDGPGGPSPMGGSRAREIFDQRFAGGELTADQYREQLKVLGEGR